MAPCTLTDLIGPRTCILASIGIAQESETLLREGSVPEDDGHRGEHDKIGEAIVGPSSMDMNPSPSWHIPTTSATAMMIPRATIDLEYQGVNLKPYKAFISQKCYMSYK